MHNQNDLLKDYIVRSSHVLEASSLRVEGLNRDRYDGVSDNNRIGIPVHVGPAIIDEYEPIHVGPAIVDEQEVAPVIPAPSANPPLVQIVLNINSPVNVPGSPVVVETIPQPTPVQVVEEAEVVDPVIVVDKPVITEPVIVAPIVPSPVVVLPDILN
ncbi:PREDICTED: 36.4 kDa proline-rich protein-like [Papilio polytes]|uniref:36.4 kDa proline-rich protein-like n=1 Tax=Papilio polytes TaxID=76194 RepID=UPI000675CF7D|nr:PREDICTED: 36.4 kDa proline-rich protein-like [Papilio polytes]